MSEVWRDVHVWSMSLDQPRARVDALLDLLSLDERERASGFHFSQDRRQFIVGRGVLRLLLSGYLHLPPTAVKLAYGAHGKPFVSTPLRAGRLEFNLAHSHEIVLYAFARSRELGVDVEYVRQLDDYDQIASRFFSPRETAELRALPAVERLAGFFRCWTRKEAYIKALGDGLRHPLDGFAVPLAASPPARLLTVRGRADHLQRWTLRALSPAPGYEAAVAVEGRDWQLPAQRRVSVAGLVGRSVHVGQHLNEHSLLAKVT